MTKDYRLYMSFVCKWPNFGCFICLRLCRSGFVHIKAEGRLEMKVRLFLALLLLLLPTLATLATGHAL